jgi:MFS family permease
LYFTIYLGSGALGPIVYGRLADSYGLQSVFMTMAAASLAVVPVAGLYHFQHRRRAAA